MALHQTYCGAKHVRNYFAPIEGLSNAPLFFVGMHNTCSFVRRETSENPVVGQRRREPGNSKSQPSRAGKFEVATAETSRGWDGPSRARLGTQDTYRFLAPPRSPRELATCSSSPMSGHLQILGHLQGALASSRQVPLHRTVIARSEQPPGQHPGAPAGVATHARGWAGGAAPFSLEIRPASFLTDKGGEELATGQWRGTREGGWRWPRASWARNLHGHCTLGTASRQAPRSSSRRRDARARLCRRSCSVFVRN